MHEISDSGFQIHMKLVVEIFYFGLDIIWWVWVYDLREVLQIAKREGERKNMTNERMKLRTESKTIRRGG